VSLAGPLMDLLLLGVVSLVIWLAPEGTPLARFALAYFPVPLSLLLFNLNPFLIRMDGYWVAVDLLEQPNLRRMTVQLVLSKLLALAGKPAVAAPLAAQWVNNRRLRTICMVYGACALLWTVVFLGTFVISLARGILALFGALA
jgi:hypothetical protein